MLVFCSWSSLTCDSEAYKSSTLKNSVIGPIPVPWVGADGLLGLSMPQVGSEIDLISGREPHPYKQFFWGPPSSLSLGGSRDGPEISLLL